MQIRLYGCFPWFANAPCAARHLRTALACNTLEAVDLQENVLLAPYTTLGVGGPARWFADVKSDFEIVEAVRFARTHNVPFFILGGGSNLLVSDEGFPGVVLRMANNELSVSAFKGSGEVLVKADAGVEWDMLVRAAVEKNAAGVECLAGIPGSVGGTPVQNVGAYGQEVSSTITQVFAVDLEAERGIRFNRDDCGFSYRRSIFNSTHRGRYAITQVAYRLELDGPPRLSYRDVQQYFVERAITQPSLARTAQAVREIRARKGMVLDENDPDSRSAGSFFKNPIVSRKTLEQIATLAGRPVAEVPQYPAGEDHGADSVKLSAAWLIELAGFHRGFAIGRASLSTKHVLAIVNRGGATASEILTLRDTVISEVQARTGIRLEQEPVLLGFSRS